MSETEAPDTSTSTSSEATVAAKWWADKIRNVPTLDNSDKSERGGTTMMMAALAQDAVRHSQDLSEPKIALFESTLAEAIDYMLEQSRGSYGVSVGVDYHPDKTLNAAAASAGMTLDILLLPWKTSMQIKKGQVLLFANSQPPVEIPIA